MKYANQIIETLKEAYNKPTTSQEEQNKENKPLNEPSMPRRESTSLASQSQLPKLMRSSSMHKI